MLFLAEKEKRVGVGIGVMILKGNSVLLGKRNSNAKKADSELRGEGTWTMPGGKMRFGESLEEGARREVLEETGIRVDKSALEIISVSSDISPDGSAHFVTTGFLCRQFDGEPQTMEPEEITEWRWLPLNELPKPIFFPSEKILKAYLERKEKK